MEPLPALVSSLWTSKGTAHTHTHTQADARMHSRTHVVSLTRLVIYLWKKKREMTENGGEMKQGSCAP